MTIQGEGVGRQGQVVEGLGYATAQPRPGVVPIAGLPVAGRGGAGESGAGRGISVMAWCIAGDGDLSPNSKPTDHVSHHHVANELIDLRGWIR